LAEAASSPFVNAGATNQAAGNQLVQVQNDFVAGDTITFQVSDENDNGNAPNTTTNCTVANDYIGYSAVPTVSVVADNPTGAAADGDTTPTVTASISTNVGSLTTSSANCGALGVKDVLTLTFGKTATGTNTAADRYDITVSGIKYTLGAAVVGPQVNVAFNGGNFNDSPGDGTSDGVFTGTAPTTQPDDTDLSNATIEQVAVAANVPPIGVNLSSAQGYTATNVPISPITITENVPGAVPANWVCVTFKNSGNTGRAAIDTTTQKPTVSVTGGGAVVSSSPVTIDNTKPTISFQVTTASTTAPATFTLSKINIDDPNDWDGPFNAVVRINATSAASCAAASSGSALAEAPSAFDAIETDRIAGATVDDTSAAQLNNLTSGCLDYASGNVVLVRNDVAFDALPAAFMAGVLESGTLTTAGGTATTVSNATMNALRSEGAQTVYVLGGSQAISDAIVSQLQNTPSYQCGGTVPRTSGGVTQMLRVIRIFGQTQDGTAAAAAQYFGADPSNPYYGPGYTSSLDFSGAYSSGLYNDTTGASSTTAPDTSLLTAIVATDGSWQDAAAAGAEAWADAVPLVLTPAGSLSSDAANALINLGVQQVIVMGGPLAVSDNVVTQLQAMGLYVLRIAGQDYTDTAQLFARFFQNTTSDTNGKALGLDWGDSDLVFARGDYFGDGLVGAETAGYYEEPLLFTVDPNTLGQYLTSFLNLSGTLGGTDGVIGDNVYQTYLGGNLALTPATVQNMLNAVSAGNNAG
jgi:putative cell wall-binding protein